MTFSTPLAAEADLPPASSFTVKTNGTTTNQVMSLTRPSTTTVLLVLQNGIEAGTPVTVSYLAPAVDNVSTTNLALQGAAGNDAQSFTDLSVINTASMVPKLSSAVVPATGNTIALTFTKSILTTSLPDKAQFSVTYGGMPVAISTVAASGSVLTITLVGTVAADLPVRVSYTPPTIWTAGTANIALQDSTTTGADALPFTNFSVTATSSAVPYILTTSVATGGNYVYLNYNEDLEASTIKTISQFTLKVNGVVCPITDVRQTPPRQVYIRVDSACVGAGQTVTVSYTPTAYSTTTTPNTVIQDVGGADAPALVDFAITNTSTKDLTGPNLQSAEVSADGNSIRLNYNEELKRTTLAPVGQFTVLVNGISRTVSSVTVPAAPAMFITLNFAAKIGINDPVTLTYAPSGTSRTQDAAGNYASGFANYSVTNNSTADVTAPVLQSVTVPTTGNRLILRYNEAMGSTLPAVNTTNFGVTVAGTAWLPTGITVSGNDVILTGPATIEAGKTVVLTKYTAPTPDLATTNAAIQDTSGNDAVSLTNRSVVNDSTLDITAPTFVSAVVNGSGQTITLTYSEELLAAFTAPSSSYVVKVNASPQTISNVAVSGSTIVLTLGTVIEMQDVVRISYTAGSSNSSATNLDIQDLAGLDASSLSERNVTANNSTVDTRAPQLLSGTPPVVSANGLSLTLTFDETISQTTAPISSYTVLVNSVRVIPTALTVSGSTVVLTFGSAIGSARTVTVEYVSPGVDPATTDNAIQDLTGSNASSFLSNVTNSSTVDQNPPLLAPQTLLPQVSVAGNEIFLQYSETLSATTAPLGAYVLKVNGVAVTISTVVRHTTTNQIKLTVPVVINGGDVITLTYVAPSVDGTASNAAIQDVAGNDAAGFTDLALTNYSTQGRPAITALSVTSNQLTITGNKAFTYLTAQQLNSTIKWYINGVLTSRNYPTNSAGPAGGLNPLTYPGSFSPIIYKGDVVTVTYTEPDTLSGTLRTVTNFPVTNNSTTLGRPVVSSIVVDSAGTNIRVNYGGTVPNPMPTLGNIQWSLNGEPVSLSGTGLTTGTEFFAYTSSVKIFQADVLTASYVEPNTNIATVKTFNNLSVTNQSTADGAPPVNTALSNTADGTTLTLTFNEALLMSAPPLESQFTITTNGYPTTVTSFSMVGSTLVLNLSSPISAGSTTSVTYTPLTSQNRATTNPAIQDSSGNDTAVFTRALSVNSSTVQQLPPMTSSWLFSLEAQKMRLS